MEKIMRFRHNVMNVNSLSAFEGIRGRVNQNCKDVYFVRLTGMNDTLISDLKKMDYDMTERMQNGHAIYQRIIKFPVLSSPQEAAEYESFYQAWLAQGKEKAAAKTLKENAEYGGLLGEGIRKVVELYADGRSISLSMEKNFVIKMLFWHDCLLKDVMTGWDSSLSVKLVLANAVKQQEYLFAYLLTLLGYDVLLVQSAGDISEKEESLGLSQKIRIGEFGKEALPEFLKEEIVAAINAKKTPYPNFIEHSSPGAASAAQEGQRSGESSHPVSIVHPGRSSANSTRPASAAQAGQSAGGSTRPVSIKHPGRSSANSTRPASAAQAEQSAGTSSRPVSIVHPGRSSANSTRPASAAQTGQRTGSSTRPVSIEHPGRSSVNSTRPAAAQTGQRSGASTRPVSVAHPARSASGSHASSGAPSAEMSFEQLAMLGSSVVMIAIHDRKGDIIGTGSGIMIGAGGYILTNNHVACGGRFYSIRIEDDDKVYSTDEVIKYHSVLDLAVLRIDRRLNPLPIYKGSKPLVRGQKVVAIGSPLGLFNSVSDGIISGFRKIDGVDMIQFTAPTSHGSSGGAVLNMYGEVIGISTAGFDGAQNINLAMGYECINQFIAGFV